MHYIDDIMSIKANNVLLMKISHETYSIETASFPKVNVIAVHNMSERRQVIE